MSKLSISKVYRFASGVRYNSLRVNKFKARLYRFFSIFPPFQICHWTTFIIFSCRS